jgi:hypothetical protein
LPGDLAPFAFGVDRVVQLARVESQHFIRCALPGAPPRRANVGGQFWMKFSGARPKQRII